MLSVQEKRSRLETLLERVKINRNRLDERVGRVRGISEHPSAISPTETVEQEVAVVAAEQVPIVTPISAAEQEAVSVTPEPTEMASPETVAPVTEMVVSEETAAVGSIAPETRLEDAAEEAIEEFEPVSVATPAVATTETALTSVEPEPEISERLVSPSTVDAGDEVEPQEPMVAVAADAAPVEPAATPVEPDDAVMGADAQSDAVPSVTHFEPAIKATDSVVEITGRGPSSWTMKAVFERAWTLGSRKDQS